jgi:predicted metal-dependent phosphoesterase TrpH
MPLPDRDQQIVQTHAAFIREAVECIARADARVRLEALLKTAVEHGWTALAEAVRRIAGGQRELTQLTGLDEEDRVIAAAILRGLRDPATLPDPSRKADPALAAPGLAHMIHAAGRSDPQALSLISQMAEQMSRVGGDMSRLAAVIRPMISGERNPDTLCARLDTRGRQLVLQILDELARLGMH